MEQSRTDRLTQEAVQKLVAGETRQAEDLLAEVLRIEPSHPMGLTQQAQIAIMRKDAARALTLTDLALAQEPNFAPAWNVRAAAFWFTGQQDQAVAAARRAVDIQPPNPDFRLRLAQFCGWTGHEAEARTVLLPLLADDSVDRDYNAMAISMLGELAIAEGRFADAEPLLDQALSMQPALSITRMLRGMNLLRLGRFAEGWADYAVREGITGLYPDRTDARAARVWAGENPQGKTLLVTDDQGHGDAIQFFRYLPLLRDRGIKRITWRTFPALLRLFAIAAPYADVVDTVAPEAAFDLECNSTRLPSLFGTELGSIPAAAPYLASAPRQRPAAKRLRRRQPTVGLVWSGDAKLSRDHLRSIPGAVFLQLADVPGVKFHSLQHEVRPADLPALAAYPQISRNVEKSADFADTAALIDNLDLVIAVDTAVAHLAAAMGKPVWLILHVAADWRWLIDRDDSPWYPTMRLFRVTPEERSAGAGWQAVLDRVKAALGDFAA